MTRLEDLRPNAAVRGILPDAQMTVVTTQWFGSHALELTYKNSATRQSTASAARTKTEVRATANVKASLKLAAERERYSAASMIKVLVLDCAEAHGLTGPEPDRPERKSGGK